MKARSTFNSLALSLCALALSFATNARATDGTWISTAGGNWSAPANWSGSVVADGAGDNVLFNTLDITALTTVNVDDVARTNSNLVFSDADTNTAASWVLAGAGLTISNNLSVTVSNLAAGQTLTISAPLADIITNSVAQPSTLTKLGSGTLILGGANSYSGGTIVSNGTLQISADGQLGASGTPLSLQGGTFFNNGSLTLTLRPVLFGQNNLIWQQGGSVSANSGGLLTGVITNNGGGIIFKTGTGNLRFGNNTANFNTFTNPIVIAAGSLQAVNNNNTNPFGSGPITISNNLSSIYGASSGNNVFISNNIVIPAGITLNFDAVGGSSAAQTTGLGIFGNISGAGNMQKGGGGNGTFGGDNSGFTGTFTGNNSGAGNFSYRNPNAGSANATWIFNNSTALGTGGWANQAQLGAAGGIIRFGSVGGTGSQPLTKNTDAGNVIFEIGNLGNNDNINFAITASASGGTLGINKVGTGTLTLNGANTYNGPTTISNGVLVVTNESRLGAVPASFTANQLVLDGGALSNSMSMILTNDNRGITLGTASGLGGTFTPGAGTVLTISNFITGGGSLSLANTPGLLSLNNANTYTGKTFVKSGVLSIGAETALGNSPVSFTADQLTLNGGTLSNRVVLTINNANRGVTLGAAGGSIDTSGGTLTIANAIAGGVSGTLTKAGSGILSLTTANSYSGTTLINSGTLALGASGSISSSALISDNATFDVSAVSGGFVLASGQTLGGNGTVSGNVTAPPGSTFSAGNSIGQLNISGNVTFSGGTNLVEINNTTNDIVAITGNLTLTGTSTIKLNAQSGLSSGRRVLMRYTGSLSGAGSFVLSGAPAGTTVDTSVNHEIAIVLNVVASNLAWKGDGTLNNWDSTSFNWSNLVSTAVVQYNDGDNVTFSDTGSQSPAVNLAGTVRPNSVTVNATGNYTISGTGKISGVAVLTKTNSGTLTLLSANDYSGGTLIFQGIVQAGNGTTIGTVGSGDITANATLNFNPSVGVTNAGALHGSGSLNVQGGKVAFAGNGDFSGATVISPGATLQIGAGGSSGALGGGTISDLGTLAWNRTGSVTNSSVISGGGNITVSNSVTVALTGDSPGYSGPVTIDTGVLQLGAGGASGTIGVSAVTLANNGGLAFSRSDTLTNGITLYGTGSLIQQGPGTVVLTNLVANYGSTVINGGTLQIGDGSASGTLTGGTVADNGVLAFNRPDAYTITNRITGTGSLKVIGGGTNTLNAPSPYNSYGGTVISNATLIVGTDTGSLLADAGGGAITLFNSGVLKMANADSLVTSSVILWEFANDVIVPTGQTGTVLAARDMRAGTGFHGSVSGGGTMNFRVNGPREEISGDWSGFTGLLNIITNAGGDNFNTISSIPSATVNIGEGTRLGVWSEAGQPNANSIITLGAVTGTGQLGAPTDAQTANGATFVVSSLNSTNEFDGVIANEGTGTTSIRKVGTGTWILTGINTYSGNTTISNGVLALSTNPVTTADASIASSATITVVSPGVLDASGLVNTPGELQLSTTLAGNGTVKGGINDSGTIAPGFSTNVLGNLTVSSNVTVQGSVNMKIDRNGNTLSSDKLTAPVVIANGSTLNVTEVSTNDLRAGDTFTLFSVPVTGAGFGAINITPTTTLDGSITYGWDLSKLAVNGTIVLTNGAAPLVNTSPTNIITTVSGSTLTLTWPSDHTGWGLQVQTNSLNTGLGTNWHDVPSSSTGNNASITISPANGSVFYRLIYPPNVP